MSLYLVARANTQTHCSCGLEDDENDAGEKEKVLGAQVSMQI